MSRTFSENERGGFLPRPTVYGGEKMRSRLEAAVAAWMDGEQVAWSYEGPSFASSAGTYLPDFTLPGLYVHGKAREVIVEVKPDRPCPESFTEYGWVEHWLRRMEVVWGSKPEAALLYLSPRHRWVCPLRLPGIPHILTAVWMRCHGCDLLQLMPRVAPACGQCGPGWGMEPRNPWLSRQWQVNLGPMQWERLLREMRGESVDGQDYERGGKAWGRFL
jgi:hypothetical protein